MQTVHSETAVRSDTNFRTKEQRARTFDKSKHSGYQWRLRRTFFFS